jgi:hypothetical protein
MAGRSVLYLGNGEQFDNINGMVSRKWRGPGDIIDGISPMQSDKLCAHAEFEDVTELAEKDPVKLAARVAKAKADADEKRRKSRRPETKDGRILEYASDEDIEAELSRRRKARAIQENPAAQPIAGGAGQKKKNSKKGKPEKPKEDANLKEAIDEAIASLVGNEDAFESGVPKREFIEGALGFSITEDEYVDALGGQALTEIPDKTGFMTEDGDDRP